MTRRKGLSLSYYSQYGWGWFIHAAWALMVLLKKDESAIRNFHKFSILVWVIWLIPYFSPMFVAITK